MFQFLFHHYSIDNRLIWNEIKILIQSNCSVLLIQILFSDRLNCNLLVLSIITIFMIVFDILLNRTLRIILQNKIADRVMIIGIGKHASDFIKVSRTNRFSLMKSMVCIDANDEKELQVNQTCMVHDIPIEKYKNIDQVIHQYKINSVMIAIPNASKSEMSKIMRDLFGKVPIIKFMPRINGMFSFETVIDDFDGQLVISSSNERKNILGKTFKRIEDILASLVGVLLLIPLTIVIKIISIKNGDYDSIFFTQERIGQNGRPIKIYKFRSMVPNAEEVLEKMMVENENIRNEYLKNKKLVDDPRITKIGHFIRKTSIDEFPQFINVLKGEMSLIGPRPYLYREIVDMDIYYETIIKCKPGITGMWQANGRSYVSFHERCKLDDYYYRNWNFWLDFVILFKTVKSVIYGEGAI